MVKSRKYVLLKQFQGEPKRSDFEVVEEELPPLKDNEVLIKAEYLSVDPYMRAHMIRYQKPLDMIGSQVSRIIESKHKDFPVGGLVVGQFGWRTHTIVNPDAPHVGLGRPITLLPDFGGLSSSLALGVLGMPGNTAYFGLLDVLKPQPGEIVVVTGAAGAVGSLVGQIAKIKGCTVIGFAGSDDKCQWLKEELGFDVAINYKTADIESALKEAAPEGVDCFFDNVGGEVGATITNQMRHGGRVTICGCISQYNAVSIPKVAPVSRNLINNEVSIQGFYVYSKKYAHRWNEGITQNLQWIKEGKLKYSELFTEGFDNMVDGFVGMLRGNNSGKAVVKA